MSSIENFLICYLNISVFSNCTREVVLSLKKLILFILFNSKNLLLKNYLDYYVSRINKMN